MLYTLAVAAALSFQPGLHVQRPALAVRSSPAMVIDAHAANLLADAAILLPPPETGVAAQQAATAAAENPGFFDRCASRAPTHPHRSRRTLQPRADQPRIPSAAASS